MKTFTAGMRMAMLFAGALGISGVAGCGGTEVEPFVGSWAYAPGSTFMVNCGGGAMPMAADTVVETFQLGSSSDLVKNDSQGCAGQKYNVSGNVATLTGPGQSCNIPGGTYTANSATFTLSADRQTVTAALAGTFAPTQAPGMTCTTSANATLAKKP